MRSAGLPVILTGSPINVADHLIGSPITWHHTVQKVLPGGAASAGRGPQGRCTGAVVPAGRPVQVQLAALGVLAGVALRVPEALRLHQVLPVRPAIEGHLRRRRGGVHFSRAASNGCQHIMRSTDNLTGLVTCCPDVNSSKALCARRELGCGGAQRGAPWSARNPSTPSCWA